MDNDADCCDKKLEKVPKIIRKVFVSNNKIHNGTRPAVPTCNNDMMVKNGEEER